MKYRLPITLWSVVTIHFQEIVPSWRVGAAISVAVAVRSAVVIYSPSSCRAGLVLLLRPGPGALAFAGTLASAGPLASPT